jgi:hypothetical protein
LAIGHGAALPPPGGGDSGNDPPVCAAAAAACNTAMSKIPITAGLIRSPMDEKLAERR